MEYLFLIFVIVAAVQSLFFIVYSISIGTYKQKKSDGINPVSIIVCARNELQNLKANLSKLVTQEFPNYEVIVVNDRSTDESYEFLVEQREKYPNLKVVQVDSVPDHIHSKKYAITLGIKAAKNEHLLFTDADCQPVSPKWIEAMDLPSEFVLGVSLYKKKSGLLNLFIRFETYITAIQYIGNALLGKPYMGVGRNLGYKKHIFLNNKGFGNLQSLIGGDDDLFVNKYAKRKNTSVVIGEDALVYSEPKTTFSAFMLQKKRHLSVGKYYKFSDKIILGLFALSFVLFWISGIALAFFEPYIAIAGFSIRLLFMIILFFVASKRFGERFVPLVLPVLDFLYVIYYISAGTAAAFTKKIRWS